MNKKQKEQKDMEQDDVVFEQEGEIAADTIKKLRVNLKKSAKESKEYLEGWQRAKAEFQNFKNNLDEERERFAKFAKENILLDMLPVMDSFEMAFANKEAWGKVDEGWRKGVEHIYSQMKSIMETNGISEIDPTDKKFDPERHISVEAIESKDKKEDGYIAEVVQKGYALDEKVLRPARVKVLQYKHK